MLTNIILHIYLCRMGDPKVMTAKIIFCCAPSKYQEQNGSKFFFKSCLFPRKLRAFSKPLVWKSLLQNRFQDLPCQESAMYSNSSLLRLFDSILWGRTLKQLGVFWKTDPRWLPFVPFLFFQSFLANLHANIRTNPIISFWDK